MKKQLAVLAATAVLGVTSAFAANPFSDVTPQDWAYQAVAQLASQGIVNGYPDGTFKGQNNITRYEMAQMVAKALVRQDRVDAEQNAIINRLANEFSAELNNLGVRVATLENKVGNFAFTGDARLKYEGSHTTENAYVNNEDSETDKRSKFDYRARVQFEATVNDNTKAVVRLATGDKEFGAAGNPETTLDRVYVQHNFGKYATATVGRQDLVIGSGLTYDGAFEGAQATVGKDKLNATVSYGYMVDGDLADLSREENAQTTSYQLNAKLGKHVDAKGYYVQYHGDKSVNYFGGAVDTHFGPHSKVWLGGEYSRFETLGAAGEGWTAGIGYGKYDITKPGTWGAKAQYFRLGEVSPVTSPTWNLPDISNSNFRGWLGTIDYAVAKNVGITANAQLRGKYLDGYEVPDYYRVELNYQF
ncbi:MULTISPECIES: putative porin [unclassified Veillonella]|uniref:putative porin n=1 Tax=unclassified Veillonella TaxID=2630086 RepID=UPI000F8D1708|nr:MULTISPECIES: putative porin [unclassified Veillonella]